MIRIKRMRDQVMTGKYCIVSGKVPTICTAADVVNANADVEEQLLDSGMFEVCSKATAKQMLEDGGLEICQDDIDVSILIDGQTPRVKANINLPRQKAILNAIEKAGGVDKVDPKLKEMLIPEAVDMLKSDEVAA